MTTYRPRLSLSVAILIGILMSRVTLVIRVPASLEIQVPLVVKDICPVWGGGQGGLQRGGWRGLQGGLGRLEGRGQGVNSSAGQRIRFASFMPWQPEVVRVDEKKRYPRTFVEQNKVIRTSSSPDAAGSSSKRKNKQVRKRHEPDQRSASASYPHPIIYTLAAGSGLKIESCAA